MEVENEEAREEEYLWLFIPSSFSIRITDVGRRIFSPALLFSFFSVRFLLILA